MVRKFCVTGCKSNYLSDKDKVTVYRLPFDSEERQRWMKSIPRDITPDSPNISACVKYFLPGFPVLKMKGKSRPRYPPSVFDSIPKSLIPTPPPPK